MRSCVRAPPSLSLSRGEMSRRHGAVCWMLLQPLLGVWERINPVHHRSFPPGVSSVPSEARSVDLWSLLIKPTHSPRSGGTTTNRTHSTQKLIRADPTTTLSRCSPKKNKNKPGFVRKAVRKAAETKDEGGKALRAQGSPRLKPPRQRPPAQPCPRKGRGRGALTASGGHGQRLLHPQQVPHAGGGQAAAPRPRPDPKIRAVPAYRSTAEPSRAEPGGGGPARHSTARPGPAPSGAGRGGERPPAAHPFPRATATPLGAALLSPSIPLPSFPCPAREPPRGLHAPRLR